MEFATETSVFSVQLCICSQMIKIQLEDLKFGLRHRASMLEQTAADLQVRPVSMQN